MITASSLERLSVCPASGALPQARTENDAMRRGSAVHAFLEDCTRMDRDAALALVPAEHRDFCAEIDLSRLPFDIRAKNVHAETAYAYDVDTGLAHFLGKGLGRDYGKLEPTEIAGTMDIEIRGDENGSEWVVHVRDYKVGFGIDLLAPPPEKNKQLRFYALAAARARDCDAATIARISIDENGEIRTDEPVFLDAIDLSEIAREVLEIHMRVDAARGDIHAGRTPSVTESSHCRYCPAFASCPAKTALIRQVVTGDLKQLEYEVSALLTPETARLAYERIKAVSDVVKRVEQAVYAWAAREPIDLGDGTVLGPTSTQRESIDGNAAIPVLRELYGDDVAEAACEWNTSKTRIRDALKGFAQRSGGKLAPLEREALAALREAGAVTTKTTESVREHRVKETA